MRVKNSTIAWAAIAIFAVAYLLVARFGLDAFPASGDEHSYLFQGHVFASGHLSVPAPANAQLFEVDHVVMDDVVRSKYPPAWPALLALGVIAGAPWIVNPILGALLVLVVWRTARRLFGTGGSEAALVAALFIGCSPFLALNAASFHSHVMSTLAGAVYVYCLVRSAEAKRVAWAALGGLALGVVFLTRPVDAALLAVAALAFYRTPRLVLACGAPAALVASSMLAYQAVQFGSPWTSGYAAYEPMVLQLFGKESTRGVSASYLLDPATQWYHLGWFADLAAWTVPGMAALAIVGLWKPARREPAQRFVFLVALAPCLLVPLIASHMGDAYGPRYLLPLLVPMALAAGAAWMRLRAFIESHPAMANVPGARRERAFALALAAMLACGAIRTGTLVERSHVEITHRSSLYRRVAGMCLDHAVVVVKSKSPTLWARNLAPFDGPVLYVSAWGRTDAEVAALFPDRGVYAAEQALDHTDWAITRVR